MSNPCWEGIWGIVSLAILRTTPEDTELQTPNPHTPEELPKPCKLNPKTHLHQIPEELSIPYTLNPTP